MKNTFKTLLLLATTAVLAACNGNAAPKKEDPIPEPEIKYINVGFGAISGRMEDIMECQQADDYSLFWYQSFEGKYVSEYSEVDYTSKEAVISKGTFDYALDCEKQIGMIKANVVTTEYTNYGETNEEGTVIYESKETSYYFVDSDLGIINYLKTGDNDPTITTCYSPLECYLYWQDECLDGETYFQLLYMEALSDIFSYTGGFAFYGDGDFIRSSYSEDEIINVGAKTTSKDVKSNYQIANVDGSLKYEVKALVENEESTTSTRVFGTDISANYENYFMTESKGTFDSKAYDNTDPANPVLTSSTLDEYSVVNKKVEHTSLIAPKIEMK